MKYNPSTDINSGPLKIGSVWSMPHGSERYTVKIVEKLSSGIKAEYILPARVKGHVDMWPSNSWNLYTWEQISIPGENSELLTLYYTQKKLLPSWDLVIKHFDWYVKSCLSAI